MSSKLSYTGLIAGLLFISGTIIFGYSLEGYNPIQQTVSEIGKVGSPAQATYALLLYAVGTLSILFAIAIVKHAKQYAISTIPAWLVGLFGVLDIGFAIFPTPEPMHNIMGLGHLFGYFAPLLLAIMWRKEPRYSYLVTVSWLASILIVIGLVLNLSPMFKPDLYPLEYYGVVQRLLLYSYYLWLIWLSLSLARKRD